MQGAEEDALEANAAGGSIPERDEKMYAHNNNTDKAAHPASSSMCGPNYSTSAMENDGHAMASNPTSRKAKRNGAIAVSSFVDQAFSLNLPGHNIRLVSVPANNNSARLGNSTDLDGDDYDEEGGNGDVKGPFLTSYYPLIPLLLSLCFPVLVLYQHYSQSCNFDAAAAASSAGSAADPASNEDYASKNQSSYSPSSILQNFIVANLLRLLLAIVLVVYGPTVKFYVDRGLRCIGRTSAWQATEGILRRIAAYVWGRSDDDQYRYSSTDDEYAPPSLFLGSSGYNRERTASGSSLGGSHRSTSSATGHLPALKGLAALTLIMLAVHPDGCLWYILATLRDGICSAGDGLLTLLFMIGDGDVPSLVVTGALLSLFVAAREIRRALFPAEKVPESTDALGSNNCSAGKSGKGRNKKGKKGKGRGSGRGRIRHQQSRTSNQNQQHQQHRQYPNNIRHENSLRHQSSHSLKSSASSQISVSSLEEQKIQDLPGRSRLESSDVSDADPSPPTSGNSDPPAAPSTQDLESSGCVETGSALEGGVVAADSLASDQNVVEPVKEYNAQGNHKVAPQSELLPNPSTKKKYGGKKEEVRPRPISSSLPAPASPRTSRQASASSSGSHLAPPQFQRSKGGCTPVRKSKGPKGGTNTPKHFSVETRNRTYDQPRSPVARPTRYGGDHSANSRPHAHYKSKQKQGSCTTSPKDGRLQKVGKVEGDPWQSRARGAAAATAARVEKPDSLRVPLEGANKTQNDTRGRIKCDRELALSSPGRSNQSVLRPPPGLAPLLDTARSPAKDLNSHQSMVLPPIGHDSTPIGGDELSGLGPDRTVLGIPSLQSDHTDGFLSRTPLLGTDPARARCLSGDDMSVFSVGTSSSVGIPSLSPLPQSTFGGAGGVIGGSRLVAHVVDDDDRIEADLQELGGQMVGSVLD